MRGACLLSRLKFLQVLMAVFLGILFMTYYVHLFGHQLDEVPATRHKSSILDDNTHLPTVLAQDSTRSRLQKKHRSSSLNRFVLSLNYWEQLTMATVNLFSLVCMGKWWNATTVQPFTFNSRLYGLRNFKPDDNFNQSRPAHKLDLIYDTVSLNKVLKRRNLSSLADFNTFLQHSPRDIIVAHYISPRETHELTVMKGSAGESISQGFKENSIIDCRELLDSYLQTIESAINSELASSLAHGEIGDVEKFRIAKYWCINMTVFSRPQEIAVEMGLGSGENVSIVVVNWRGFGTKQVIKGSVKGDHMNNRIAVTNRCTSQSIKNWKSLISYSPQIIQNANQFRSNLGLTKENYAVVHIRSEKLGLREPRFPGVTVACFRELMRLIGNFSVKHPSTKIIYITDYGPFSSDTCRKCRGSKTVKQLLHKQNITPSYFDPSSYNSTIDTGFAAGVESQFISSATFVFLCGGGAFQNQIAIRFQEMKRRQMSGRKGKIERMCNDDEDINTILKK